MELYGKTDNDSIRAKDDIFKKYSLTRNKKESDRATSDKEPTKTEVKGIKTPSGIVIPKEVIQESLNSSDTIASFRSKLRTYVNKKFFDKSTNARNAAVNIAVNANWKQKNVDSKSEQSEDEDKTLSKKVDEATPSKSESMSANGVQTDVEPKSVTTASNINVPAEKIKEFLNTSKNLAQFKTLVRKYIDKEYKDKSYNAKRAAVESVTMLNWRQVDKVKSTKPEPVKTQSSIQDQQASKQAASSTTFVAQQQIKSEPTASQVEKTSNISQDSDATLLNATVTGNQSIGQKLDRIAELMGQQIVVTADSKVATEKMAAEGSIAALQTAMDYTNRIGKQVRQDMKRPVSRPAPISVVKTAYA